MCSVQSLFGVFTEQTRNFAENLPTLEIPSEFGVSLLDSLPAWL